MDREKILKRLTELKVMVDDAIDYLKKHKTHEMDKVLNWADLRYAKVVCCIMISKNGVLDSKSYYLVYISKVTPEIQPFKNEILNYLYANGFAETVKIIIE